MWVLPFAWITWVRQRTGVFAAADVATSISTIFCNVACTEVSTCSARGTCAIASAKPRSSCCSTAGPEGSAGPARSLLPVPRSLPAVLDDNALLHDDRSLIPVRESVGSFERVATPRDEVGDLSHLERSDLA